MFLVLKDEDRATAKAGVVVGVIISIGSVAIALAVWFMLVAIGSAAA